jgi:excisionase family DNA binding protein
MSEIMTIEETCLYLRIPRSSLYKLAQAGKIPCQKVGRHWRFHKAALERWIEGNNTQYSPPTLNILQADFNNPAPKD